VFNREVLATAGEFVLPQREAIEAAIGRLMEDQPRRHELSAAAKWRAAEDYSWDSVCDAYEQSLTRLVDPAAQRILTDEHAKSSMERITAEHSGALS
jgi:glycosyltransferase involved in cell wall biosynthesis